MDYDYNNIVHRWFEELRQPFIHYIRKNFRMDYDEVNDIYSDSWMELRKIILNGKATDDKWRALIFKIGWREANKKAERQKKIIPLESLEADGDADCFNLGLFEFEKAVRRMHDKSVYENSDLYTVLGTELGYIPDPCNRILKMYYYDDMSMTEIAETMNYRSSRSAITTKNRCLDKLKARVKDAVRRLGILD